MSDPQEEQEEQGGVNLPVDPRALLISFIGKLPWLISGVVFSFIVGLILAISMTERVYKAETVLLYNTPSTEEQENASKPSLFTLVSMIKLQKNLADVREELQLPIALGSLGRAIDVQITRLRKKMEPDPKSPIYIQTIRGQGYLLRLS